MLSRQRFRMNLSEDQILALAPDEASKKAGLGLANLSKWVTKGANDLAIWGECQGSGSKPYQAQIDLSNIAFKCSCPSRKFPCKHGLALFLLYARQTASFTTDKAPAWVAEWLEKRAEKQEKKAAKEEAPVDEAAQAKRQLARHEKVMHGIAELQLWIKDIVRNGILSMPEKGFPWFENVAKRMVDAQAPGLANMVRQLGETNFFTEDWQQQFLEQLLKIYLVAEGYSKHHTGEAPFLHDLRSWIGFTSNQDELKEQTGITDTWLVLAKQSNEVDNVTTEKYWLYGMEQKKYALILQFTVRGQGSQLSLTPGLFIQAELVFFPSVNPMRALIKRQLNTQYSSIPEGFSGWEEVTETHTAIYSRFPVQGERPYIVEQLTAVPYNNLWWLRDQSFRLVPLRNAEKTIWHILAISGGQPLNMVLIGSPSQVEVAGVWQNNQYLLV